MTSMIHRALEPNPSAGPTMETILNASSTEAKIAELEEYIARRTVPKPTMGHVVLVGDIRDPALRLALETYIANTYDRPDVQAELRELLRSTGAPAGRNRAPDPEAEAWLVAHNVTPTEDGDTDGN